MNRLISWRFAAVGTVAGALIAVGGISLANGATDDQGQEAAPQAKAIADYSDLDSVRDAYAEKDKALDYIRAKMRETGAEVEPDSSDVMPTPLTLEERFPAGLPEGMSLTVYSYAHPKAVADCKEAQRTGEYSGFAQSGEGPEADAIYCAVMLKIDAGELAPTGESKDGLDVWSYNETELRKHAN